METKLIAVGPYHVERLPGRVPLIYVPAVVCPHCGATRHETTASHRESDGSRLARKRCKACGGSFAILEENPE